MVSFSFICFLLSHQTCYCCLHLPSEKFDNLKCRFLYRTQAGTTYNSFLLDIQECKQLFGFFCPTPPMTLEKFQPQSHTKFHLRVNRKAPICITEELLLISWFREHTSPWLHSGYLKIGQVKLTSVKCILNRTLMSSSFTYQQHHQVSFYSKQYYCFLVFT